MIGLFFAAALALAVALAARFERNREDYETRILYDNIFLRNDPATGRDWPPWGPPSKYIDGPRDIWLTAQGRRCPNCGEQAGVFLDWGKSKARAVCRCCHRTSVYYIFEYLKVKKLTTALYYAAVLKGEETSFPPKQVKAGYDFNIES